MENIRFIFQMWNYISRKKCSKTLNTKEIPWLRHLVCEVFGAKSQYKIQSAGLWELLTVSSRAIILEFELRRCHCSSQLEDLSSVVAIRLYVCTTSNVMKMVQTESKCHAHCEMNSRSGFRWQLQARRDTVNEWCGITAEPSIRCLPATPKLCLDWLHRM